MALQRRVQKELRFAGMSARPDAVRSLVEVLHLEQDPGESLAVVMRALKARLGSGSRRPVAADDVRAVVDELLREEAAGGREVLRVVDAEAMPQLALNPATGKLHVAPATGRALPALVDLQRARLALLRQRVLRHPMFARSLPGLDGHRHRVQADRVELAQVEALGARGKRCVLGVLARMQDGLLHLADLNGQVALDLAEAQVGPGLVTEGCAVLVEGEVVDGVLRALNMVQPPAEPRGATREAHGGLDAVTGSLQGMAPVEDLEALEEAAPDASFAVLCDVHLDDPQVLRRLDRLLAMAASAMPEPPALLALMGNFSSRPFGEGAGQCGAEEYAQLLAALAALLARHQAVLSRCKLVLVPGPDDPGSGGMLPRRRLPTALVAPFQAALLAACPEADVHFASNPCRVLYHSQELVLLREDALRRLRRHCVTAPDLAELSEAEHLARTLLQQGHLSPLPPLTRPVVPALEPAMRLYPLPQVLLIGDRSTAFVAEHAGTQVGNPGPFGVDGGFLLYSPAGRQLMPSRVPDAPEDSDGDGEEDERRAGEVDRDEELE